MLQASTLPGLTPPCARSACPFAAGTFYKYVVTAAHCFFDANNAPDNTNPMVLIGAYENKWADQDWNTVQMRTVYGSWCNTLCEWSVACPRRLRCMCRAAVRDAQILSFPKHENKTKKLFMLKNYASPAPADSHTTNDNDVCILMLNAQVVPSALGNCLNCV